MGYCLNINILLTTAVTTFCLFFTYGNFIKEIIYNIELVCSIENKLNLSNKNGAAINIIDDDQFNEYIAGLMVYIIDWIVQGFFIIV